MEVLIPIVGIIFALSIPIIAIIVEYFHRKNKLKLFEKAIEKGVTLEGLSLEEKRPRLPCRSGMVTLAMGLGIAIFAFFFWQIEEEVFYPILGVSFIPALIGLALI